MEIGVRLLLLCVAVLMCTKGTHGAGHFSSFRIDGLFTCQGENRVTSGSESATAELWWGDAITYGKATGGGSADQILFTGSPYAVTQDLSGRNTLAKLEGYGGYDFGLFKYAYVLIKNAECNGKTISRKWFKIDTDDCEGEINSGVPSHEMYKCKLRFELSSGGGSSTKLGSSPLLRGSWG